MAGPPRTRKKLLRRPFPRARFWRPASPSKRLPHQTPLSPRRPLEIRCCADAKLLIEVKYAEGGVDSVVSDTGSIWRATRAAKTLHGDTAKQTQRRQFVYDAGVFFADPGRAINTCAISNRDIRGHVMAPRRGYIIELYMKPER